MGRASAQPATAPVVKPTPPLTLAELEKLIGGRTTLTLNLNDATLEEAALAISASSGLKVTVQPPPVFKRPPGMENMVMPIQSGPRYSFEAKGGPFWEEFLNWQRAAIAAKLAANQAQMTQANGDKPIGFAISRRTDSDLGLFQVQNFTKEMILHQGNPLFEGRTLVSWPYVMVGTRLTRTQAAVLDETGLHPLEDTELSRKPPRMGGLPAVPDPPKIPPTEAQRWIDGLILGAQTYLDPKIKPVNLRCEVEEAIDDKGNDLRLSSEDAAVLRNLQNISDQSYSGGVSATMLSIPIRSRQDMGKKLVRLRGTLRFTVVTLNQHWETTDLETPTAGNLWRDGNQFAVGFKGLTKTANGWEVGFGAEGRGQRLRQFWDQWFNNSAQPGGIFGGPDFGVQLVDDKGQIFFSPVSSTHASLGTEGDTKTPTAVKPGDSPLPPDISNLTYTETATRRYSPNAIFGGAPMGKPVKLIVDLPIERREVVVPFEFTDLPLPPS